MFLMCAKDESENAWLADRRSTKPKSSMYIIRQVAFESLRSYIYYRPNSIAFESWDITMFIGIISNFVCLSSLNYFTLAHGVED